MNKSELKTKLNKLLGKEFLYIDEYQDRYYLCKEIQKEIPDLNDGMIYQAIDHVTKEYCSPLRGKKFVELFVEKIVL